MGIYDYKEGDTVTLGLKEFEVQNGILHRGCPKIEVKKYTMDGLLAEKSSLEAKLTEVNEAIEELQKAIGR
jgi:hypothetical protein